MWSTAQGWIKIDRFDVDFESNHRSVGYGEQCLLLWSRLEKGIRFLSRRKKGRPKRTWKKQRKERRKKVGWLV